LGLGQNAHSVFSDDGVCIGESLCARRATRLNAAASFVSTVKAGLGRRRQNRYNSYSFPGDLVASRLSFPDSDAPRMELLAGKGVPR
jgi:hypothetical protein